MRKKQLTKLLLVRVKKTRMKTKAQRSKNQSHMRRRKPTLRMTRKVKKLSLLKKPQRQKPEEDSSIFLFLRKTLP